MSEYPQWKYRENPNPNRKILKERSWMYRNPRLFNAIFTTSCLLVFFSRPIYDLFFRDYSDKAAIEEANRRLLKVKI